MDLEKKMKDKSWTKIVKNAEKIYDAFLSWERAPKVSFDMLNPDAKMKWIHISLGKPRDGPDEAKSSPPTPAKPKPKQRGKRQSKDVVSDFPPPLSI